LGEKVLALTGQRILDVLAPEQPLPALMLPEKLCDVRPALIHKLSAQLIGNLLLNMPH
jgi:hypothetical protein